MKKIYMTLLVGLAIFGVSSTPSIATIINIPDAYPTIQEGIDVSVDGDTVLVQPGTYVENINFNGHNIVLGSLFLTTGDIAYIPQTIIDGDSSGSVVTFESGEDSTAIITGFVVQNGLSEISGGGISSRFADPTISYNYIIGNSVVGTQLTDGAGGGISCFNSNANISNNIISGNVAVGYPIWTYGIGGGIYCYNSGARISNNLIHENNALGEWGFGGGLSLWFSSPILINNVISENSALHWGGGIHFYESSPIIVNNVLSENTAGVSGGGIYCELVSNPIITNTIFWADSASYSTEIDFDDSSSPYLSYCDIQGGWAGEGNIDEDPLFRDPTNGDFHLMSTDCGDPEDSPCIDVGSPAIIDSLLDCDRGLDTILSDMGAYGGGDSAIVGIDNFIDLKPDEISLAQNYPNPFNAQTIISYNLSEESTVSLMVFSITGQLINPIINKQIQPAGEYKYVWEGTDLNGQTVSTGIYFYELFVDEHRESKAMILVK
ncbi:MAG: T9SS type A sorting domain-containing protein [candidate division Zixibacteria bacterium]